MRYFVSVVADNHPEFTAELQVPLEIGRQQSGDPPPFQFSTLSPDRRLIIADAHDVAVSRRQLRIEPEREHRVRLINLSAAIPLQLAGRPVLGPGQQTIIELPGTVSVTPGLYLTLSDVPQSTALQALPEMTQIPGRGHPLARSGIDSSRFSLTPESEPLIRALQTVLDAFLSAKNERELFASATDGAVTLIGLETARILQYRSGTWHSALVRSLREQTRELPPPSRRVLRHVRDEKKTFWDSGLDRAANESLLDIRAVIGAPILDASGEIIGALYGDRRQQFEPGGIRDLTSLDARLIELLASGVASGLERLHQQELARQLRHQFEQFFTSELAAELEQNPDLLAGQDADVSLLFCDIRGFSRISERIGATETFHWIHDVMDTLSDCVLRWGGVLVDYIGDELMAMWGAPRPQIDHAFRACQAAVEMLESLPTLNERWSERLGEPVEVAIGLNSGLVKVGNAGSRQKFKYSPLGNAVNLASRILGANRYLGTSLLMTGTTSSQLPAHLIRRKLCDVQVVNVDGPVELVELLPAGASEQLIREYDAARTAFEDRQFRTAAHLTARLLEQFPDDGPALVLLSRAVQALVDGPAEQHPVWKLLEK